MPSWKTLPRLIDNGSVDKLSKKDKKKVEKALQEITDTIESALLSPDTEEEGSSNG